MQCIESHVEEIDLGAGNFKVVSLPPILDRRHVQKYKQKVLENADTGVHYNGRSNTVDAQ